MVLPVHYDLTSQIQLRCNIYCTLQTLISILTFPNNAFKHASTPYPHTALEGWRQQRAIKLLRLTHPTGSDSGASESCWQGSRC